MLGLHLRLMNDGMENLDQVLLEAANIMAIGMVVVFSFLTILIFCIKAMSKICGGEEMAKTSVSKTISRPVAGQANQAQVTAAISAAVHQHRKRSE